MALNDTSLYWTPHDILTYNAMFNFIVGGRGTGKTYGALNYCIQKYIKQKTGFIYLRRYDTDLTKKERLLSTVAQEFPKYNFSVEGQKLLIRRNDSKKWDIMGYCMPLSKANSDKSIPFEFIDYIIYDEFLRGSSRQPYLKNEVEAFLDFYNTVDRYNDRVRCFFLANSTEIVNPYFLYYKMTPRQGDKIKTYKDGYIAFQYLKSKNFIDEVSKTRFGQMIKDTPYYDYAVSNEFRDDTDTFIAKKTPTATFHSAYTFDGRSLSLWQDIENGVFFVSEKVPKDKECFILTRTDMQPNMLMIERSNRYLKKIMKLYMMGCLFFDNINTRGLFYDILDYLNLR